MHYGESLPVRVTAIYPCRIAGADDLEGEGSPMKLFEFEAKNLASNLGITTPRGAVASSAEEARDIHKRLGGAGGGKGQGLVAGRGEGGGIKIASKPQEKFGPGKEMVG